MSRKTFTGITAAILLTLGFGVAQAATITVGHGIDGSDLGLPMDLPVDVAINGDCALTGVPFGAFSASLEVPAGLYDVEIKLSTGACDGTLAITVPLAVQLTDNATVIAYLTDDRTITAGKFVNDVREIAPGAARLIVRHTADAPTVDVYAQANGIPRLLLFPGLSSGDQGKADVPGDLTYKVALTAAGVVPMGADDAAFGPVDLPLNADEITIVYAVGSLSSGTFTVLLQSITP